jgi:uncharacterized protein DUF6152
MRPKSLIGLVAACGLFLAAPPVFAHHSFAAEFDAEKPVKVTGAVVNIEWLNPHIWLYIDVKNEGGKVTRWSFEGGPPNALYRQGWRRESLKAGDMVTVDGFQAKDGTHTANARAVMLPDGRKVFAGSAEDGGPKESR